MKREAGRGKEDRGGRVKYREEEDSWGRIQQWHLPFKIMRLDENYTTG